MGGPLVLDPQHSRLKQWLTVAIHLIATIAFACSSLATPLVIGGMAVIMLLAGLHLRADRRIPLAVLELDDEGMVTIHGSGIPIHAHALSGSTDLGWALWLQWRESEAQPGRGRVRSGALMLLPDQFSAAQWRQLRVWLRHKAGARLNGDRAGV